MSADEVARLLLSRNQFKLSPVAEDGSWKAAARVAALIAGVNLDFWVERKPDGRVTLTGYRQADGDLSRTTSVEGDVASIAEFAVDTVYRASRS